MRTIDCRSVQVCGDRLIKRQTSLWSRLERERSYIGARVGKSCGLFEVPEVLSFDDAAGEIVFRFVRDAVPLKTYFASNPCTQVAQQCGRALGHIHMADSPVDHGSRFLHGDYGMGNLLYSETHERLTIVDWSNAHWTGMPPEQSKGPAGLDLGIAILSLFHRMFAYGPRIPTPELLGLAFLKGYALTRPCFRLATERHVLSMIQRRWRRYFLSRWGVVRTLAVMPSWVRTLRFLSMVERDL